MKKVIIIFSVLLFINFSNKSFAQGEAAIGMLYLNPSPELNGLGWTGVSYPNNDAFGFYYNPANLGHFSQNHNFSMNLYPNKIDWFNSTAIKFKSSSFNIGYNFKEELNGLNLSVGAGFIHSELEIGFPDPFHGDKDYDKYNAYGLGTAINLGVIFSAGISLKNIHSEMNSYLQLTRLSRAK